MTRRARLVLVPALAALSLVAPAAQASPGIHATIGTATIPGVTLSVNAAEPGTGTVTVNSVVYNVVCMQVSSFTLTPGGAHDVFIKAQLSGTTGKVFIRILDHPTAPDRFGINTTGLTFGIACDADQNVTPVTTGSYITLP